MAVDSYVGIGHIEFGKCADVARFSLPKQDLTPELAAELKAIRLRAYMDPKRFYKGNDTNELPTHFHIGVISFRTAIRSY